MGFAEQLERALASCQALLVVIGEDWSLERLQSPDDFVRIEVESAVAHGASLIPVVLPGAKVPPPSALPPGMQALSASEAYPLRLPKSEFSADMQAIQKAIAPSLRPPPRELWRRRVLIGALVLSTLAATLAVAFAAVRLLPRVLASFSGSAGARPDPAPPVERLTVEPTRPDASPAPVAATGAPPTAHGPAARPAIPPFAPAGAARATRTIPGAIAGDTSCLDSTLCKESGLCVSVKNDGGGAASVICVAGSDRDCRATTEACPIYGQCSLGERRCIAKSDADCRNAKVCAQQGECSASNGFCVATADADCKRSVACHLEGSCTAKDRRCVAGSDEDCRASELSCQKRGKCTAKNGVCIAAARADCVATLDCKERGWCTPIDGACHAGSDADCRESNRCPADALCSLAREGSSPSCKIKSNEDCKRWVKCKEVGKCKWTGQESFTAVNVCYPGSDADCRRSVACKKDGRCVIDKLEPQTCTMPPPPIIDGDAPRAGKPAGASKQPAPSTSDGTTRTAFEKDRKNNKAEDEPPDGQASEPKKE